MFKLVNSVHQYPTRSTNNDDFVLTFRRTQQFKHSILYTWPLCGIRSKKILKIVLTFTLLKLLINVTYLHVISINVTKDVPKQVFHSIVLFDFIVYIVYNSINFIAGPHIKTA